MAFPKRKETDEQQAERTKKIRERNEAQGCDSQGRPVDKAGHLLKNLGKNDPYKV